MSNPIIEIKVKNYGTMKAELYPEMAPNTVGNFLKLAGEGFYEGLIFHRVIEGFMIQGGGYNADFDHKEADAIDGEFASNGCPSNTLKHSRGVLSMARTNDPDSASSQFFVMHADSPHLDGQYAAFGKLTEGFDVLDAIAGCDTGRRGLYMQDVPKQAVEIESISVIEQECNSKTEV